VNAKRYRDLIVPAFPTLPAPRPFEQSLPLLMASGARVFWKVACPCYSGFIAESAGYRIMETATSWKSPKAGLSHSAGKSNNGADFHFFHRPGYDDDSCECKDDRYVAKE
jgi:hypothetical protein